MLHLGIETPVGRNPQLYELRGKSLRAGLWYSVVPGVNRTGMVDTTFGLTTSREYADVLRAFAQTFGERLWQVAIWYSPIYIQHAAQRSRLRRDGWALLDLERLSWAWRPLDVLSDKAEIWVETPKDELWLPLYVLGSEVEKVARAYGENAARYLLDRGKVVLDPETLCAIANLRMTLWYPHHDVFGRPGLIGVGHHAMSGEQARSAFPHAVVEVGRHAARIW